MPESRASATQLKRWSKHQVANGLTVADLTGDEARDLLCSYVARMERAAEQAHDIGLKIEHILDDDPEWLLQKSSTKQ